MVVGRHILAEIAIDPEAVLINQCQRRLIGNRIAAQLQIQIGDKAADRRPYFGKFQVQFRLA